LQLGIKAVFAKSFARIHRRNLIAQGIVALTFDDDDYHKAEVGQTWVLPNLRRELAEAAEKITVRIKDSGEELGLRHDFSDHERDILIAGGLLSYLRDADRGTEADGARQAKAGGGRTEQAEAGERAETDGAGKEGLIREPSQGVGGQHE
jgi:3-isopropylmalate dehydratase small subunit